MVMFGRKGSAEVERKYREEGSRWASDGLAHLDRQVYGVVRVLPACSLKFLPLLSTSSWGEGGREERRKRKGGREARKEGGQTSALDD